MTGPRQTLDTSAEPAIALEHVTRTFDGDPTTGIRDVTLSISRGEFVAIIGPSGAGKSTLLNILGLLDTPVSGTYRVLGQDVTNLRERERDQFRSQVFGFVFQQSFVLGDISTLQNAGLGLRTQHVPIAERSRSALEALTRLGIAARAHAPGRVLSGGEQQRLAIARAIATSPRIVLADEPTGNLDQGNGAAVLSYLRELNAAGVTVILITHDEAIAASADRVIRVIDGTIATPPDDTSPRPPLFAQGNSLETESNGTRDATDRAEKRRRWRTAFADDASEAINVVTTRLLRTIFLMLAFALGVGGLVASMGMSESASAQVSGRLTAAALDEVRVTVPGGRELLQADDARLSGWVERATQLPHVVDAGYVSRAAGSGSAVLRFERQTSGASKVLLMSASPSYLTLSGATPLDTDSFSALENPSLHGIAFVGADAAHALELPSAGPGAQITVNGRTVDVIGTFSAGPRGPELGDAVIVSPDVLQASSEVATTILVRTEAGYPASIADALPFQLDAANPGQFNVETVADLRNLRYGVSNDLGQLVAIISLILLTLAAISAATTMYLSVQTRAHEISLRRAVGASRTAVGRLFIAEGLIIGIIGGAIGAAVGSGATLALSWLQGWLPVLDPWLPVAGIGLGVLTGFIASLVPAWTASKQNPALALRAR